MSLIEDYSAQLMSLLPQGLAWPREKDAHLTHLLQAIAQEWCRVHQGAEDFVHDAVPTDTVALLPDWEYVAGLSSISSDIASRQKRIIAQLNDKGGQSRAYFEALAAHLGFDITIQEFLPFRVGIRCAGEPLTNAGWVFTWQVHIQRYYGNLTEESDIVQAKDALKQLLERYKPAHTQVQILDNSNADYEEKNVQESK